MAEAQLIKNIRIVKRKIGNHEPGSQDVLQDLLPYSPKYPQELGVEDKRVDALGIQAFFNICSASFCPCIARTRIKGLTSAIAS